MAPHPPNPASPLHDSPLSPGAPSDHQGQVFLLGLKDPRGLSFPGHPQHQDPPETHKECVLRDRRRGYGWEQGVQGRRVRQEVGPKP